MHRKVFQNSTPRKHNVVSTGANFAKKKKTKKKQCGLLCAYWLLGLQGTVVKLQPPSLSVLVRGGGEGGLLERPHE